MSKPGHNSGKGGPFSNERLKSFIERIERVEEERKALGGDIRDIYAEAKSVGYDVGTMRKVIRLRAMSDADRAEQQALLETYLHALGMIDRIDARLEAGESQREIAAAEGVSKSTVQRRGPKVVSFPASSKMDHPKPEDGDDGITDAAGRDPGIEGESDDAPDDLRVSEADRSTDGGHGQSASRGQGVQRRAGCLPAGGPGQDVRDPGTPVERDVGERGDHAAAGRDAARLKPALDLAHNEVQPSAPVSVGAVASPEGERVAPPYPDDDDLTIPSFLDRRTPAQGRAGT